MEFKEYIQNIVFLIRNSDEYRYCIQYIQEKKIERDESIHFLLISSWYLLIIELCKIVHKSKNQHFNIHDLLDNINTEFKDKERPEIIESIKSFSDFLSFQKEKIESVKDLRNKFYAHTDKDKECYLSDTKYNIFDFKILIDGIKFNINNLCGVLFNSSWSFAQEYDSVAALIDFYLKGRDHFKREAIESFIAKTKK